MDAGRRPDGPQVVFEAATRRRGRVPHATPAGVDELVDHVARDLDTTKSDAKQIVDSVARGIAHLASTRQLVRVPHLGNFRVLETGAREGRNPRTGESVPIAPGRRLTFRAARGLKNDLGKKTVRGAPR